MKLPTADTIGRQCILVIVWLGMAVAWGYWISQQKWRSSIFVTALEREAGWYAVPREVRSMKQLAHRHPAESYQLHHTFTSQLLIIQRATEFLYPLRIDEQAPLIFTPLNIQLPDCRQIDIQSTVTLHDCSPK